MLDLQRVVGRDVQEVDPGVPEVVKGIVLQIGKNASNRKLLLFSMLYRSPSLIVRVPESFWILATDDLLHDLRAHSVPVNYAPAFL
jgi:hypothetical protein